MKSVSIYKETKLGLFPENWNLIKAKDFCKKVTDGTHDTPKPHNEGYFLVTSKNLTESGIDFSESYCISERDYIQINQRSKVDQYDILFGMIGTVGNTTIVTQEEIDFAIKNVGLFKMDGDLERAMWLKNYLSSHIFTNYLKKQQAGTTQQFVSLGFLRKSPIVVPHTKNNEIDWAKIKAINYCISKVDESIETTEKCIEFANKLRKSLVQNLLSGKLKPNGTWRTEDEFYLDENYGTVPIGWDVKKIKDCFDFYPTSSYSRSKLLENGEVNYIHYGDIHTKFDRVLDAEIEELPFIPNELRKKYELMEDGDLVVSDASEDWDGVGKSIELINIGDKKIIAGLHTLHLRPKSNDLIKGIKGYILNIHKVAISIKRLATGMKVYGISKPNLGRVYLPIPPESEQIQIKEKLDNCSVEILIKEKKINTLQRLKKSLMQNLLTGKLEVDVKKISRMLIKE